MDADCYIVHISCACNSMYGMSLISFDHGSEITVIDSRELTDTWGSGVEVICIYIL